MLEKQVLVQRGEAKLDKFQDFMSVLTLKLYMHAFTWKPSLYQSVTMLFKVMISFYDTRDIVHLCALSIQK